MPRITVDGNIIDVPEGRTVLQALDEIGLLMAGVDIPHYCWHPKLSIDGSCRLCQVEVEGVPKLQISCNTPVQDGMVVNTKNERVKPPISTPDSKLIVAGEMSTGLPTSDGLKLLSKSSRFEMPLRLRSISGDPLVTTSPSSN